MGLKMVRDTISRECVSEAAYLLSFPSGPARAARGCCLMKSEHRFRLLLLGRAVCTVSIRAGSGGALRLAGDAAAELWLFDVVYA